MYAAMDRLFSATEQDEVCQWWKLDEGYAWSTSCGKEFQLDGTPARNEMKFCCFCGARLEEE